MENLETLIEEKLAEILKNLRVAFRKFKTKLEKTKDGEVIYRIDIDTDEASSLIGYHGETIYALQHILKTILWQKMGENILLMVDVDSYRKRQEESVIQMARRKVEQARTTLETQVLPPMSPYFRRVIHLYLAEDEFHDIETESIGEGDRRQVTIKLKNP